MSGGAETEKRYGSQRHVSCSFAGWSGGESLLQNVWCDDLWAEMVNEEREKARVQKQLAELTEQLHRLNESIAHKQASRNEYDKTIKETEAAYMKVNIDWKLAFRSFGTSFPLYALSVTLYCSYDTVSQILESQQTLLHVLKVQWIYCGLKTVLFDWLPHCGCPERKEQFGEEERNEQKRRKKIVQSPKSLLPILSLEAGEEMCAQHVIDRDSFRHFFVGDVVLCWNFIFKLELILFEIDMLASASLHNLHCLWKFKLPFFAAKSEHERTLCEYFVSLRERERNERS